MVRNVKEIYECEHLRHRKYFVEVPGKKQDIKFPGPTAKMHPLEWDMRSPAPDLHQNDLNSKWDFEKSFNFGTKEIIPDPTTIVNKLILSKFCGRYPKIVIIIATIAKTPAKY